MFIHAARPRINMPVPFFAVFPPVLTKPVATPILSACEVGSPLQLKTLCLSHLSLRSLFNFGSTPLEERRGGTNSFAQS